ncbi:TRAP transporter small permease [Litorisediminicola beolgyonensis]|uniref:TRAP transporter small permease protein n=1 Tax=Litorisediminicola beolgyonensis TaxID=1173614 RepID=A0ABW3ZI16_9RHOB
MRDLLDRIYLGAGWIAAFVILAIAVLVSAQVLLNFTTRVLGLPLPSTIPSYADFSGFMLAAATFLAMPYTFRSGGHIKVSLITSRLSLRWQLWAELCALAVAAALVGFACYFTVALVLESWHYNDVSPGIVPIPLWLPQSVMAFGLILLLVAIVDSLVQTYRQGTPVIAASEEA